MSAPRESRGAANAPEAFAAPEMSAAHRASASSATADDGSMIRGRVNVVGAPAAGSVCRRTSSPRTPDEEPRRPLMVVAVAMAAGIAVDRYMALPVAALWVMAVGGLAMWGALAHATARVQGLPRGSLSTAVLLLSVAAAGGLRHHMHWRLFAADEIGRFAREMSEPVCLDALVLSAPRVRPAPPKDPLRSIQQDAATVLRVRATALRDGGHWRAVDGRATMTVNGVLSEVRAGDRVRIVGRLQAVLPPGNPGEFDFALYRRGDRELASLRVDRPDCIQVVERAPVYSWRRALCELRMAGDRLLWGTLSRERAGLAAAVLLGAREQIDDEMKDQFLVTGTVHILSISGLHVGILAYVLFKAFRTGWLGRGPALAGVALVTLAYALVTDAEPPALRATVLVWAICGATYLFRGWPGTNALALAAIFVLALNPADLFRTGAQLSFLSVATLMVLASRWPRREENDALTRLIHATRPMPVRLARRLGGEVGALALGGVLIWLVTTPLVAHQFHVVSLTALVLNIVLWIPVLLAMVAGFAILAFGWLVPPLGSVLGAVCDLNLAIIDWSIEAAARLPAGHFWVAGPSAGWMYVFYALLAMPYLWPKLMSYRQVLAVAGAWALIGLAYVGWSQFRPGERELVCSFVSVGHGSAVVLELPDGQVWLYDAGRLGSPRAGARSIEGVLRSRRISRIDAVILSHADIDHYNALPELLEKFSIETIYVSPQMFREPNEPLIVLREAIAQAGVPVETLVAGDALVAGRCTAKVLHPPRHGVEGNDNAQSIVLAVEYAGRRVLLAGDLEREGVRRVLTERAMDCDILMAPHHGSANSDPAAVVSWSTPEYAVISSGPADQGTRQYRPLLGPRALCTSEVGAVRADLGEGGVEVRAWRVNAWE